MRRPVSEYVRIFETPIRADNRPHSCSHTCLCTLRVTGGLQLRAHYRTDSVHEVNNKYGNTWRAQLMPRTWLICSSNVWWLVEKTRHQQCPRFVYEAFSAVCRWSGLWLFFHLQVLVLISRQLFWQAFLSLCSVGNWGLDHNLTLSAICWCAYWPFHILTLHCPYCSRVYCILQTHSVNLWGRAQPMHETHACTVKSKYISAQMFQYFGWVAL